MMNVKTQQNCDEKFFSKLTAINFSSMNQNLFLKLSLYKFRAVKGKFRKGGMGGFQTFLDGKIEREVSGIS